MDVKYIFEFLKGLQKNNNKEWFQENRSTYNASRETFLKLLQQLIDSASHFDEELYGLDPKKCIYRINRDIRFSKDKTPYKTHFGGLIGKDGRKTEGAEYYFQIAPGETFIGGGIYAPSPSVLAAIRQEIDYNPEELIQLIESEGFKSIFGAVKGAALKTAPKGYPKDHPHIQLLRQKSFYILKKYSDKEALSDGFLEDAIATLEKVKPFNNYLRTAIS